MESGLVPVATRDLDPPVEDPGHRPRDPLVVGANFVVGDRGWLIDISIVKAWSVAVIGPGVIASKRRFPRAHCTGLRQGLGSPRRAFDGATVVGGYRATDTQR